jgi:hypothetical protein
MEMRNAKCRLQNAKDRGRTQKSRRVCLLSFLHFAFCILYFSSPLFAQQLLDRIVARVAGTTITLTDVTAAIELGVVQAPEAPDRMALAIERLIDRQLALAEVARFAPPEPDAKAVERELSAMLERVGSRLNAVMASTGVDETRIREMARDTLRIEGYVNQRFGTTMQVSSEEVTQYYRAHPEEFTRDGMLIPFEDAEPIARERAGIERRTATIAQWMRDLRARAEVVVPTGR